MPEVDWRSLAACRGHDPEMFFPNEGRRAADPQAHKICRRCPVDSQCYEFGATHLVYGLWGGTYYPANRLRTAIDWSH